MSATPETVVGRPATVITRIRGDGRPGEVQLEIRGGTEVYIAYAEGELARGTRVLVIGDRGHRSVDVVEHPGFPPAVT